MPAVRQPATLAFCRQASESVLRNEHITIGTNADQGSKTHCQLVPEPILCRPTMLQPAYDRVAVQQFDRTAMRQLFGLKPKNMVKIDPSGLRITAYMSVGSPVVRSTPTSPQPLLRLPAHHRSSPPALPRPHRHTRRTPQPTRRPFRRRPRRPHPHHRRTTRRRPASAQHSPAKPAERRTY